MKSPVRGVELLRYPRQEPTQRICDVQSQLRLAEVKYECFAMDKAKNETNDEAKVACGHSGHMVPWTVFWIP